MEMHKTRHLAHGMIGLSPVMKKQSSFGVDDSFFSYTLLQKGHFEVLQLLHIEPLSKHTSLYTDEFLTWLLISYLALLNILIANQSWRILLRIQILILFAQTYQECLKNSYTVLHRKALHKFHPKLRVNRIFPRFLLSLQAPPS